MLIEHHFVTTLDGPEAMSRAATFLRERGFEVEPRAAFAVAAPVLAGTPRAATPAQQGWNDLSVKRGKKNVARARDVTECPQQIRLEWDRGRVSIAATIMPKARTSFFLWGGVLGAAIAANSLPGKAGRNETDLILAIARSIEELLGTGIDPAIAPGQGWAEVEKRIKDQARRARRRGWIIGAIILLTCVGLTAYFIATK